MPSRLSWSEHDVHDVRCTMCFCHDRVRLDDQAIEHDLLGRWAHDVPAALGMSRSPGGVIVGYRIPVRPGSVRIDGYGRSVFLDCRLASGAGERDAQTDESEHQPARGDPEVREAFHGWIEARSPNDVQPFRFPSSHRTRNRVELAGRSARTGLASVVVADQPCAMATLVSVIDKVERKLWTATDFLEWLKPGVHVDLFAQGSTDQELWSRARSRKASGGMNPTTRVLGRLYP